MYLQYAKFELANSKQYIDTYNYLMEKTNNTFIHEKILRPYFGPKVGKKQVGGRIIFWVIVPTIALTWELLSAIWGCIFRKKKEDKNEKKPAAKSTADEKKKEAPSSTSPTKKEREKID